MDMTEYRYSVLVVSSSEKFNSSLSVLLSDERYSRITTATDVSSARRILAETPYDIVIINSPLPDDFGTRLALDICNGTSSGVLLLVRSEHYSDINARVFPYGVLTVSKPVNAQTVLQSLQLLCGTRQRLQRMEKKTASLEEKMEEIRLVNRAKWQLIGQLKMSESEAHRYIEKQAMDRCITKRAVAEKILSTYKE